MQDNKELLRAELSECDINDVSREAQLELLCDVLNTFPIGRIQEVTVTPAERSSYALVIKDDLGFEYEGQIDKIGGVGGFIQLKDGAEIWAVHPGGSSVNSDRPIP